MGTRSMEAVTSSWAVIWKQPSPSTDHTVASGRPTFAPVFANTCYSLLAPEYGISVADIFRATPQGIVAVQGAGGVSPRTPQDAAQHRLLEARYAYGWYSSTTREVWGA